MTSLHTFIYAGTYRDSAVRDCRVEFVLDTSLATVTFSTLWMPVAAAHAAWIDFSQGARDIALMVGGKLDGSLVRNDRAYTFSAGGSAIQMHIPHKDFGGPLSVILMNLSNEARKCRTD